MNQCDSNLKLLEKAFSPSTWEYLSKHKAFQEFLVLQNTTIEDYETAVVVGNDLIRQREEFERSNLNN